MVKSNAKVLLYFLGAAQMLLYYLLLYQTPRSNFTKMAVLMFGALTLSVYTYKIVKEHPKLLRYALLIAILLRTLALFCLPPFTDDYFRFFWDGVLLQQGISPFAATPEALMQQGQSLPILLQQLYPSLNSPTYYSIYPAVCQWIFGWATYLYPGKLAYAVIAMKLPIWLFELGSLRLLFLLSKYWKWPSYKILWYALHPLVIIECCGNLHPEAGMVFYLLLLLWAYYKSNISWQRSKALSYVWLSIATFSYALAVSTKLHPLLLAPLLLLHLYKKQNYTALQLLGLIICFTTCLTAIHIPFVEGIHLKNWLASINLYFSSFEFNASLYYILRYISYKIVHYNAIQTINLLLSSLSSLGIFYIAWRYRRQTTKILPTAFLWSYTIFFLCNAVVHPWYIVPLIAFSLFTPYNFAIIWGALIWFSYATYIHQAHYVVNTFLLVAQYAILYSSILINLKLYTKLSTFTHKKT